MLNKIGWIVPETLFLGDTGWYRVLKLAIHHLELTAISISYSFEMAIMVFTSLTFLSNHGEKANGYTQITQIPKFK